MFQAVVGYVMMPITFICCSEPERGTPSTIIREVKQRFARWVSELQAAQPEASLAMARTRTACMAEAIYDFHVWSGRKRVEKLRYMHRNPVKEGLVQEPEQWVWSSYRNYAYDEPGMVKINQWPKAELRQWPAA